MTESENSDNEFESFNRVYLDEEETLEQLQHRASDITGVSVECIPCVANDCGGESITVKFYTDEFIEPSEYIGRCNGCCDRDLHSVRFRFGFRPTATIKVD